MIHIYGVVERAVMRVNTRPSNRDYRTLARGSHACQFFCGNVNVNKSTRTTAGASILHTVSNKNEVKK